MADRDLTPEAERLLALARDLTGELGAIREDQLEKAKRRRAVWLQLRELPRECRPTVPQIARDSTPSTRGETLAAAYVAEQIAKAELERDGLAAVRKRRRNAKRRADAKRAAQAT